MLLDVRGLSVHFTVYAAGLAQRRLTVLSDLDVDVRAGEVVAVVGASGSGKSLLAHAVLGILPPNAETGGEIRFDGAPLTEARKAALRGKQIALVPQSVGWLDPLMRVGPQVRRAAELSGHSRAEAERATAAAFDRYRLPRDTGRRYPFQLSGGMARRALVSTAVVGQAKLVIADEPTPGLHPDVVAETLRHLRELADDGRGVLLITHDITAALSVADRVAVFYAGTTVEIAAAQDFADGPGALRHPYSRALWRALPEHEFIPLAGAQPPPDALPDG
jgi:peptide/nickel transport system ATP-binding protein